MIPAQVASDVVTNPTTGQNVLYGKQEQLSLSATAKLTRYWSLQGSETLNLTNSSNLVNGVVTPQSSSNSLYASVSAIYQDECMAFIGSLTQSGIRNGAVTPGVSVLFSVVFKNLGEVGGTVAIDRRRAVLNPWICVRPRILWRPLRAGDSSRWESVGSVFVQGARSWADR